MRRNITILSDSETALLLEALEALRRNPPPDIGEILDAQADEIKAMREKLLKLRRQPAEPS